MSHRLAGLLMSLAFICPALLYAEQGFYQEVGPDGHIRTVKIPQKADAEIEKIEAKPVDVKEPNVPKAKSAIVGKPEGFAAYNGDDYLDSEHLEASGFNPEKKSRFYIVNDGLTSRVEENLEPGSSALEKQSPQLEPVREGSPLPSEREEAIEAGLIKALLGRDQLCVDAESLKKAKSLVKSRSEDLLIDKRALQYQDSLGVLGAYKVSTEALVMLSLRSYAVAEKPPSFVSPMLAMADARGCIGRVVTGYFQTQYAATKAKHSMLQGAVTINPDEQYLLVIPLKYKNTVDASFSRSAYGQLSIKWQP